jgi:polyisoprenoid-binding protein YceI
MTPRTALPFAAALLLAMPTSGLAQTRTLTVGSGSRIQFVSEAPLETITGVSSSVRGEVRVDPTDLRQTRGRVEVPVASLRTGNDLRDEHLHGSGWLDAGQFPTATFEVTGVEGADRLNPGESTRVRVQGRFTIHGVTRDVRAQARVRLTDDGLRVQASFRIQLSDYGVQISAPVRLKVSNEIRVNVTLRAS